MDGCYPTPLKALKNGPSFVLVSGVSGFSRNPSKFGNNSAAELCAELLSIFFDFRPLIEKTRHT